MWSYAGEALITAIKRVLITAIKRVWLSSCIIVEFLLEMSEKQRVGFKPLSKGPKKYIYVPSAHRILV